MTEGTPYFTDEFIEIRGAREHNLQNLDLDIPRNRLVVITGVSGSGKSSMAFDTLFAEGQRRYLETFSGYARQFIGGIQRPDVDKINGLSPVIAIDQKTTSRNPRSTVGTVTEIYDFMRLLFARASTAYSYVTGQKMEKLSIDEMLLQLQKLFPEQNVMVLAPVVRRRKGAYRDELERIVKAGYPRARIDGQIVEIKPGMALDRYKVHDIETVVDRLTVSPTMAQRLSKSVEIALKMGKGAMLVYNEATDKTAWFSSELMDPESGVSYAEPEPNSFSFNSPYGYCPTCSGLGVTQSLDTEALVIAPLKPLASGGLAEVGEGLNEIIASALKATFKQMGLKGTATFEQLTDEQKQVILDGEYPDEIVMDNSAFYYLADYPFINNQFIGLKNYLRLLARYGANEPLRSGAARFLKEIICPECNGTRLKKESLHFKIDEKNIHELVSFSIAELLAWMVGLEDRLEDRHRQIATEGLKEIRKRLGFLADVGLDYLSLSRSAATLSGGEAQRIRLATQIGSQLVGVLYILDEPSIGLHQRDNARLIYSLKNLRDLGNSIIVVEHDKDMMLESDYIVDIGPGAGVHGGRVVAEGDPKTFLQQNGVTAEYLDGRRTIPLPEKRREPGERKLILRGARGHNLKNVTLELPLGVFICVTGVSGSGKSSLINQTLFPILHKHAYKFEKDVLPYDAIEGLEWVDKVIEIDQKPIGRTPRSNPATYTGLFTHIRDLFTKLPESLIRGYKPGRFSFNVKGGRCEECGGAGLKVIEMNFLPDVHVKCTACRGKRYNRETLEIRYKGKSIGDVLDMTVGDALHFFNAIPAIYNRIKALDEVGLGYVTIGQAATTLSGGEAQRMKIAGELAKRDTGKTIYILDEPTTGLHFQDVAQLLRVLDRLVGRGNTVLVIEHNLDVIKVADWVIDVGPEGGAGGGHILAQGPPETIALTEGSHTGAFLRKELGI